MNKLKINNETSMDLQKLIDSKLLIQANSGGGKSWLIRRILEQSHGKVQQIVLDPEGEFGTLREKYDYILAGKGGDTPAEPRSAALLARKLLELGVSAIIDLYELHPQERKRFVRLFLEAMVNAPKELWHPVMVVIDEAHTFVPEKGESEAANAVIGLASLGRKRGFGAILATQRISKLHKDAAAECNNKLIGRTGLDIDRKRSGEELGFTSKEEFLSMRVLKPGEFYAFGPAISDEVIKVSVGAVQTSHPKAGLSALKVAPPTDAIKKVLGKLADLPKEAEKEAMTSKELMVQNSELKRQVRVLETKKDVQPTKIEKIEVPIIGKRAMAQFEKSAVSIRKMVNQMNKFWPVVNDAANDITLAVEKLSVEIKKTQNPSVKPELRFPVRTEPVKVYQNPRQFEVTPNKPAFELREQIPLRAGAMKILNWVAGAYPSMSKNRVATLSGFAVSGGTFNTYISELKRNGWITENNEELSITEGGLRNATPSTIPSGEELLQLWRGKFREGAGKILQYLYKNYPNQLSKEEVGNGVGFESTGGTFNTYLSELRRNCLIKIEGNMVVISQEFFK